MTPEDAEIRLLIQATQASLAPAAFPPRRDLSCAGQRSRSSGGRVLFHDIFWVRRRQVCSYVVRLPGGDKHIAAAHMTKVLLRAAMHRRGAEQSIAVSLAALRRWGCETDEIDIAVAALRIDTGEADLAAAGAGTAIRLAADDGASSVGRDQPPQSNGHYLWLAVGDVPRPTGIGDGHLCDAEGMVAAALADAHAAAAVAIGLTSIHRGREHVFTLSNDVAQIGSILDEIEDYLTSNGVIKEATAGLDVALDEILTNIVLYAYDDGQAHEIILHLNLSDSSLCIEVRDDGAPFDPTSAPDVDTTMELDDRPIGGLGLHFVRMAFDVVAYERVRGWNTLTLTKRLTDTALLGADAAKTHSTDNLAG